MIARSPSKPNKEQLPQQPMGDAGHGLSWGLLIPVGDVPAAARSSESDGPHDRKSMTIYHAFLRSGAVGHNRWEPNAFQLHTVSRDGEQSKVKGRSPSPRLRTQS
jgi:hypothetical protein